MEKTNNKKFKIIIPIIVLLLIVAIVGGIGGYYIYQNHEKNKTVGTEWGDKYHVYLKTAMQDTQADRNEKYGMPIDIKDTKIQFIETEKNEVPKMALTYDLEGNKYTNIYYISDDDTISYKSYKQPSTLQLLYNIELKQYIWYMHIVEGNNHSYQAIETKSEETNTEENTIANEITNETNTETATKIEQNAEYTFTDEEMKSQEVAEGEIPTISKFEETFVIPEIEDNETSIDLNSTVDEKVLKEAVKGAVESYKSQDEIITEETKEKTEEKLKELETKHEEIKKAEEAKKKAEEEARIKAEEEAKKKAEEEAAKGLKVGNFTLKYGTYAFNMPNGGENGKTLKSTITLKPNGVFHITANFNEDDDSTVSSKSMDSDGTYVVKLNQPTGYPDEYADFLTFTTNAGENFMFIVGSNSGFGDQWHDYSYSGK